MVGVDNNLGLVGNISGWCVQFETLMGQIHVGNIVIPCVLGGLVGESKLDMDVDISGATISIISGNTSSITTSNATINTTSSTSIITSSSMTSC